MQGVIGNCHGAFPVLSSTAFLFQNYQNAPVPEHRGSALSAESDERVLVGALGIVRKPLACIECSYPTFIKEQAPDDFNLYRSPRRQER